MVKLWTSKRFGHHWTSKHKHIGAYNFQIVRLEELGDDAPLGENYKFFLNVDWVGVCKPERAA